MVSEKKRKKSGAPAQVDQVLLRPHGNTPKSVVEEVGEPPAQKDQVDPLPWLGCPQQRDKCPMRAKMVVKMVSRSGWGVPGRIIRQKCRVCHKLVVDVHQSWRAQSALLLRQFAWERYDGGLVVESSTFLHADLALSCADE